MRTIGSTRAAGLVVACVAMAGVLTAASPALANEFSQGKSENAAANWKELARNPGRGLADTVAYPSAQGISFDFPTLPNIKTEAQGSTTFFVTEHPGPLLGDLTGKTVSAKVSITGSEPLFGYDPFSEVKGCTTGPADVRLFFEGATQGKFNPTHYWWAKYSDATLHDLVGEPATLTVPLEGANWTDYYGKPGTPWENQKTKEVVTADAEGFEEAVSDVTGIGLSFGGGCFYSNGVGLLGGSASFHLASFSVE